MRGKQVFMESLIGHGVEYIFGNPGTTESPILDALLDYPQLRYVVALHEGVALGAASYYAQASGRAGVVNIHVAPGLGNALGMLYNALKARSPLVVTAGQQDTRLRLRGPVLGHDLVAMAAPLTKWSVQVERADEFALIMHRALKIATDPPAGPVFVALPIDVLEQETDVEPFPPGRLYRAPRARPGRRAARPPSCCSASRRPAIVVGDDAASAAAEVAALAERLGAAVWCEGIRMHQVLPSAHPNFRLGLPFDTVAIRKALDGADVVLLVGGPFFEEVWYAPGSPLPPGARGHPRGVVTRAPRPQPARQRRTASATRARRWPRCAPRWSAAPAPRSARPRRGATTRSARSRRQDAEAQRARAAKRWDAAPISVPRVMAELEAALPPDAIVVDEVDHRRARPGPHRPVRARRRLRRRARRRHRPGAARRAGREARPSRSSGRRRLRATARRCTASRRCGPRPITTSPSSS